MSKKQTIMNYAWFGVFIYFIFSSLIVLLLAMGGAATIQQTNPTAFDESFITFDMIWFLLALHPILVMGFFCSLVFMDIKFINIFKRKKKDE